MKKKYFFKMGKEAREEVGKWIKDKKGKSINQDTFLRVVKEALNSIKYDYEIATIEPSETENGDIYYQKGTKVLKKLSCCEWDKLSKEYAPEYGSRLATLHELFLWYAYRVAKGHFSMKEVCDETVYSLAYRIPTLYKSGEDVVGGFADGIGGTYKIVKESKNSFILCGGVFSKRLPITQMVYNDSPICKHEHGVGWLVLDGKKY